jgi:hypothetical protein
LNYLDLIDLVHLKIFTKAFLKPLNKTWLENTSERKDFNYF